MGLCFSSGISKTSSPAVTTTAAVESGRVRNTSSGQSGQNPFITVVDGRNQYQNDIGFRDSSRSSRLNNSAVEGLEHSISHVSGSNEIMMSTLQQQQQQQQQQQSNRPPYVLPNHPNFTPSINGRNGWRFENTYELGDELGKGAFGSVYKASHQRALTNSVSWKNVAIKQTRPNLLDLRDGRVIRSYDDLERYCEEIKILILLRQGSPRVSRVLHMFEYYLDGSDVFVVTELLDQDLDTWRHEAEVFTERMAIDICRTVLKSLKFISERNVVHRDIKLQNILFRSPGDFNSLKLVDFGLSRVLEEDESVRDYCGSVGYIAPEIYSGRSYRFEVDMFAFGVLLFRLLSAERPFPNHNSQVLRRYTLEYRYNVIGMAWENVSDTAKDLVRNLLIDRQKRLTAQQALDHPWFLTEGQSVLQQDISHYGGQAAPRSQGFVLTEAPGFDMSCDPRENSSRFWLDVNCDMALATLVSHGIYRARIINHQGNAEGTGGLVEVEEETSPITSPLPVYISRTCQTYTEKDCRFLCKQVAECIKIMHDAGIAHRNLHLSNLEIDPFGKVTVKGLNFVQLIREDVPLTGHFGFEYSWYAFKAPEVDCEFVHDKSVDLWSLGAIIYFLLTGLCPFRGGGVDLMECKHSGRYDFDIIIPSQAAQKLVRGLLEVDVSLRLTIEQVLDHEWMIEADDYLEGKVLGQVALENLQLWDAVN